MRSTLFLIFITTLSGCSSMFGGSPETVCPSNAGVSCISMRQAYQLSGHVNEIRNGKDVSMADAPVAAVTVSLPQPVAQPMPIMAPAKVQRIWVNNWVDSGGNLHYPTYVFSEVTPRKWTVGNASTATTAPAKVLTAYRIDATQNNTEAALITGGPEEAQRKTGVANPSPAQQIQLQAPPPAVVQNNNTNR